MRSIFRTNQIYCADAININPKVAEFICRLVTMPPVNHLPLSRWVVVTDDGKGPARRKTPAVWLDFAPNYNSKECRVEQTFLVQSIKKIPYSASDFAYPVGYHRVANSLNVMLSKNQRGQVDSYLQNFGFAPEPKDLRK